MAAAAETTSRYTDVNLFPGVALARLAVFDDAQATMEARREQIQNGTAEYVPLPIDALTTAHKVLAARNEFGEDSSQYKTMLAGLNLDCTRLVTEWYRKNKPEFFEASYHQFDPDTEDFYSHGLSIGQMTYNALTPQDNPEDDARRINERVEEATPHILRKALGRVALHGVHIRTISECTDTAIEAYENDFAKGLPHRGYNGYVPEIEKVMVRDFIFDKTIAGRFEEQIGLPGVYLTHAIFQKALERRGLDVSQKDKTQLQGTQFMAHDDLIDFTRLLDDVASEHYVGRNFFMGEIVAHDHPKDYDGIREEARQRRESLQAHCNMVTNFVLSLAEDDTDPRQAPAIVEEFVKKMLLTLARHDPGLAPQIFDGKTAEGLAAVAWLEAQGRSVEAAELLQRVEEAAPGGGFCGAGSCGLEKLAGGDIDDVRKLGFNPKDTIKDTERSCKCGSKGTVVYDLKKAEKGCTKCGQTKKY